MNNRVERTPLKEKTIIDGDSEEIDTELRLKKAALKGLIKKSKSQNNSFITSSEEHVIIQILLKIPILTSLLNQFKIGCNAAYTIATLNNNFAYKEIILPQPINQPILTDSYQNMGLIASAYNVLNLPLLFIASRILGKPIPIKLTKLAQWFYSIECFALMLTALLFPPAAIIISILFSTLGLTSGLYFLNQFSKVKRNAIKETKIVEKEIIFFETMISQQMKELEKQVEIIEAKLNEASLEEVNISQQRLENLLSILAHSTQQFNLLVNKKDSLERQIQTMNDTYLLDKSVGTSLALVALLGFILSFVFPPVGFIVLNTVFFLSASYFIGRIATPSLLKLKTFFLEYLGLKEKVPQAQAPEAEITHNNAMQHLAKLTTTIDKKSIASQTDSQASIASVVCPSVTVLEEKIIEHVSRNTSTTPEEANKSSLKI